MWIRTQRSDAYRKILDAVTNHERLDDDPCGTAQNMWLDQLGKWAQSLKAPKDVPLPVKDGTPEEDAKWRTDLKEWAETPRTEQPSMPVFNSPTLDDIIAWKTKRSDALNVADTEAQMWASSAMQSKWLNLVLSAMRHDMEIMVVVYASQEGGEAPADQTLADCRSELQDARIRVRNQATLELQGDLHYEARRQPRLRDRAASSDTAARA
jgi:hypothetical protein